MGDEVYPKHGCRIPMGTTLACGFGTWTVGRWRQDPGSNSSMLNCLKRGFTQRENMFIWSCVHVDKHVGTSGFFFSFSQTKHFKPSVNDVF